MSQVSPVVEELAAEEEVDLDMDKVEAVDLDMDDVKVKEAVEAVEAVVVVVVVVIEAVEEEGTTTVTTKI